MTDHKRTQDRGPTPTKAHSNAERDLRAELHIRDSVQPGARESIADVRDRLEELAEESHLDGVGTTLWGRRLPVDADNEVVAGMMDTVQRFRGWAIQDGADLAPAFRIHETNTIANDSTETVVTVPLVCLALYRGPDVVAVYPHTRDGDAVTVQHGLDWLEEQAVEAPPASH